jgi:CubicO group peptidase (beta-lactamase class C family)
MPQLTHLSQPVPQREYGWCPARIRWNYAGGHTVLGRLVEIWTGVPFGDFLQQELFEPLSMVDTGFRLPEAKRSRLAHNYQVPNLRGSFQQVAEAGHYSTVDGEPAELKDISDTTSPALFTDRAHRLGAQRVKSSVDFGLKAQSQGERGDLSFSSSLRS